MIENRVQTVCLIVLSAVALGGTMYWLKPVMIPFVLAVFIALGLNSLVNLQMHMLSIPRVLALISTLMLAFLAFTLLGVVITASVGQLADNASALQHFRAGCHIKVRQVQELNPRILIGMKVSHFQT